MPNQVFERTLSVASLRAARLLYSSMFAPLALARRGAAQHYC